MEEIKEARNQLHSSGEARYKSLLEGEGRLWFEKARHATIHIARDHFGNYIIPGEQSEASDFVGGLVDFLIAYHSKSDEQTVVDHAVDVFRYNTDHNRKAYITELGMALARRDRLEDALDIPNRGDFDAPDYFKTMVFKAFEMAHETKVEEQKQRLIKNPIGVVALCRTLQHPNEQVEELDLVQVS